VAAHGTDVWWSWPDHHAFLPPPLRAAAEAAGRRYVRGTDTLDVWFDSGTSWTAAWAASTSAPACPHRDLASALAHGPADMYLEGSDQHRGWFQSSLLSSVAARGAAPYRAVVTHGFVLDEAGRKMSKSLGNVVAPRDVIDGTGARVVAASAAASRAPAPPSTRANKATGGGGGGGKPGWEGDGADVLRWWVASSDYTKDTALGRNVMGAVGEAVRKLRNTARFLLSNMATAAELAQPAPRCRHAAGLTLPLASASPEDALLAAWASPVHAGLAPGGSADVSLLARGVLAAAHRFHTAAEDGYHRHDFAAVTAAVNAFAANDLSATYFDFCKDRLYVGTAQDAAEPRLVMWELLRVLVRAVAPLLPFTAEDVFQHSFTALYPTHAASAAAFAAGSGTASGQGGHRDLFAPGATVFDAPPVPPPASWGAPCPEFDAALALRHQVFKLVEAARTSKAIGSPLEADLIVRMPTGTAARTSGSRTVEEALRQLAAAHQLEDCFGVSTVAVAGDHVGAVHRPSTPLGRMEGEVTWSQSAPPTAGPPGTLEQGAASVVLELHPAAGGKCARCWRRTVPRSGADLCGRCAAHPAVAALRIR
jgi:isoleucyl-tRNA synthetase